MSAGSKLTFEKEVASGFLGDVQTPDKVTPGT